MTDPHREAFTDFADQVTARCETVNEIVLFGSVARDDHGSESDVDVLILVTELSEREQIEAIAHDITVTTGIVITPVILTTDEQNTLIETARDEGVEYVPG